MTNSKQRRDACTVAAPRMQAAIRDFLREVDENGVKFYANDDCGMRAHWTVLQELRTVLEMSTLSGAWARDEMPNKESAHA